jgi:hypothetical protein
MGKVKTLYIGIIRSQALNSDGNMSAVQRLNGDGLE